MFNKLGKRLRPKTYEDDDEDSSRGKLWVFAVLVVIGLLALSFGYNLRSAGLKQATLQNPTADDAKGLFKQQQAYEVGAVQCLCKSALTEGLPQLSDLVDGTLRYRCGYSFSNTCPYANDGECDEPSAADGSPGTDLCEAGSDEADCAQSGSGRRLRTKSRSSSKRALEEDADWWGDDYIDDWASGYGDAPDGRRAGLATYTAEFLCEALWTKLSLERATGWRSVTKLHNSETYVWEQVVEYDSACRSEVYSQYSFLMLLIGSMDTVANEGGTIDIDDSNIVHNSVLQVVKDNIDGAISQTCNAPLEPEQAGLVQALGLGLGLGVG